MMGSITPSQALEAWQLRAATGKTQTQVRVRIPKTHHGEPLISNLINRYGLKVTIKGALLGGNGQEDGWFDLAIEGEAGQISAAVLDLVELDADVWLGTDTEDGL
ncbi:MAG: NIL domain-containing protein [Nodosilinea sp.]